MRKLTSRAFRKCCSFRVLKVLNQSYWLSKSGENWRKNSKERRRQKKRHGHNFEFWALSRNQRGLNMVGSTLIPWQSSKLKIVAVSFFFDASYFRGRTSFFGLVHLWRPITPVQNLTRPISSTFSETSGREVSHSTLLCYISLTYTDIQLTYSRTFSIHTFHIYLMGFLGWMYWACEVLNGSYRSSKMDESEKTGSSTKIRGVKKKNARKSTRRCASKTCKICKTV